MHYLFSNIKNLLLRDNLNEEAFYASLGFDHKTIFNLITGSINPSPEQLILISDKLKINIDDIIRKDLSVLRKIKKPIKMLVTDVDGVMTDAGMIFSDGGLEFKIYNAKDGLALGSLERNGIKTGMLSHGYNRILIKSRAEMLGMSYYYTGQEKKSSILKQWAENEGISIKEVAYIGDDINDIDAIRLSGFSAAPSDASVRVRKEVDIVLRSKGGKGCIRELAELIFPDLFN